MLSRVAPDRSRCRCWGRGRPHVRAGQAEGVPLSPAPGLTLGKSSGAGAGGRHVVGGRWRLWQTHPTRRPEPRPRRCRSARQGRRRQRGARRAPGTGPDAAGPPPPAAPTAAPTHPRPPDGTRRVRTAPVRPCWAPGSRRRRGVRSRSRPAELDYGRRQALPRPWLLPRVPPAVPHTRPAPSTPGHPGRPTPLSRPGRAAPGARGETFAAPGPGGQERDAPALT